jgi:Uma2 family endonuclease
MSTGLKITFDEYSRLVERGLFDELRNRRIELIYGELREMPAPGPSHAELVDRLTEWSLDHVPRDEVRVRTQNPIGIPRLASVPLSDVAWVHRGDYSRRHPLPQETLLVIEVSESTLTFDTGEKAQLYAQAGIREYWVIDARDESVIVHRGPSATGYLDVTRHQSNVDLSPIAYPSISLSISNLFSTS